MWAWPPPGARVGVRSGKRQLPVEVWIRSPPGMDVRTWPLLDIQLQVRDVLQLATVIYGGAGMVPA